MPGDQWPQTGGVCGGQIRGLHDILQGVMMWPDLSTSAGPPLPKRHRWVPTAMLSHLTNQEAKVPLFVP